jgi:hypothetical protein
MKRMLILAALALSACAPQIQTAVAPYAIVLVRDGADLVIPNAGGPLRDGWEVSLDVSPNYDTDQQGQQWCADAVRPKGADGKPGERPLLTSPKYGAFNRIHCYMPGLAASAQRRIVTVSGQVLSAQGFAYRDATGAIPIPLMLP